MRLSFLYLDAFSSRGGIEKFNMAFMYAARKLHDENKINFTAYSLHDTEPDKRYITDDLFRGYKGSKLRYSISSLIKGLNSDVVILGHINLAPIGVMIKTLKKKLKSFLLLMA